MSPAGTTARHKALWAHGLLGLVVLVWGSTFVIVKGALRDCSPLLFNQLRMTLAFAILAIVHWQHWRKMSGSALRTGLVAGLFLAIGYEFQTAGLARTTPAKSAFLTGLVVVLVPLLSAFPQLRSAGDRPPGLAAAAGAVCSFSGIVLLTTPAGTGFRSAVAVINPGDILSLICAVAFALHLLSLAKLAHHIPTAQLATLQIGFAALIMTGLTPALERSYLHWTPRLIFAVLICAIFATALAFSVQSWAQKYLPATHTALLLALEPAFAWAISLVFFGEHLSRRSASGALLIFSGLLVTELLAQSHPVSENPAANQPVEAV